MHDATHTHCRERMSLVEAIALKAQSLPEEAQNKLLAAAEELAREYSPAGPSALSVAEAAELRAKLAAWEADWNAPGMELYDRV